MRIALGQAARATDEYLAFAVQLGVGGVQFNTPDLPGDERWELDDVVGLRQKVEAYGLRLEAIENIPNHFYKVGKRSSPVPGLRAAPPEEVVLGSGGAVLHHPGRHDHPASGQSGAV